jgi:flagellar hook-length control protein FliK
MTAHAVGSPPAAVPAPRSTPAAGAQNPAAPAHFDRQLHAARQRTAPRDSGHASAEPHAREPGSKAHTPNNHRTDASLSTDPQDPSTTAQAKTPTTTLVNPPAAAPTTSALPVAQVAEVAQAGAADAKAPTDAAEVDGHAASALASAMLALIGAGALRPAAAAVGAADVLEQSGKTVATDAQAALLLTADAAGAATATASPVPGMPTAVNELPPIATTAKDISPTDPASPIAVSAPPAPAAPATLPVLHLPSPVGSQGFAQDLSQQVAWLGGQNIKQARIRLHPEELGSLDVQVSVAHGRVDVVFSAQHPGAAAAVQQSLPQLDHMLAQHGLSLGHAEVGQHDRGDRQGQAAGAAGARADEPGEIHAVGTTTLGQIGLLDAFA